MIILAAAVDALASISITNPRYRPTVNQKPQTNLVCRMSVRLECFDLPAGGAQQTFTCNYHMDRLHPIEFDVDLNGPAQRSHV